MELAKVTFLLILICCLSTELSAQSGRVKDGPSDKPESRSAQALYDEARTLVERKFQEFSQ
ncbi:MAG TPA: hypothetical protein VIV66_17375, partial [Pyrinomonadaceae bacterium]